MTQQVPEEVFVLRVEEQIEGVARFLDAVGIVPEALQSLSAQINNTPIGDLGIFRGKGAQLAQAVAAGFQASMRGALAGGITPADFALQVVGGDDLRRALASQTDAAAQYVRMLQSINEATAHAKALGSPIFGSGTPASPIGSFVGRSTDDAARNTRFLDRLDSIVNRIERQGAQAHLEVSNRGVFEAVRTERLAAAPELAPSAREESQLRRIAERQAIEINRAILDGIDTRQNLDRNRPSAGELSAELVEAALGSRISSLLFRGREVPQQAIANRLDADRRIALFGTEDVARGSKFVGPGFTTPERELQNLLGERSAAARGGSFLSSPELESREVATRRHEQEALAADREARFAAAARQTVLDNESARQRREAPPLPRGQAGGDPAALVARLRGTGLGDDDIVSALGNLGFKSSQARALVHDTDQTTTSVRKLDQAIETLGATADAASKRTFSNQSALVAGRAGIALPGGLVPTGETRAEAQLRLARGQQALEGVFPREDIEAERLFNARSRAAGEALRARLTGGPLALGTGAGGGSLIPFLGSAGGAGFGGPFGPGRPPPPPRGPGGFGQVPFDFEDLDEAARFRSESRRRAREAFQASGPDFESQINEEARARERQRQREQDARDRAFRSRARDENAAFREQRARTLGDEPFFATIRDSFSGPNGEPFGRQFKAGLVGGRFGAGADLGLQLGQTAKFSLLYGAAYSALFQVSQALAAATREALAYEDALVDLEIASGRTRSSASGLAENLSETAARAGLAPSVGVALGAQSLGLFGANASSRAVQDQTAEITTRVAAQVARVTRQPADQTATQLAGTARSLGLGVESLPDIQDILTFISKRTGRSIGDLLPAISNVGTLGTGAGFSAPELAAIVGRVTSTTGQTPSAAAGSFRQVLSRADDPNFLRKVQDQFGFDTTGLSLRDVFAQVAATKPNTQEINEFSLLFGRGASQQVAQIVTRDFPQVEALATGAQAAAGTGIGEQQFNRTMATIGNQVKLFGTNILELGQDLIDTGVLDFLYLLVRALNLTVQSLDTVVDLFNEIPRPLRTIALALGELYLLARLFGGAALAARAGNALVGAVSATAATGVAAGTGAAQGGALIGAGVAGRGLRGLSRFGPLAAVLGAGFFADGLIDAHGASDRTRESLTIAERQFGRADTSAELRNASAAAREAERRARGQQGFDLSTLGLSTLFNNFFGQAEPRERSASDIRQEAKRQADELDRLAQQRDVSPEAAFGNFDSADEVNEALKSLSDRGYTATQRIEALNVAFDAMIDKSARGSDTLATVFAGQDEAFAAAIGRASTQALLGKRGVSGPLRTEADDAASRGVGGAFGDLLEGRVRPLRAPLRLAQGRPQDALDDLASAGTFAFNAVGGLIPGVTSPREKQQNLDAAADALGNVNLKRLAKRSGQDALDALRERGKDVSTSTVELDPGDIAAINTAVRQRAREELGPLLDDLPKEVRKRVLDAYGKSLAGHIRGSLGDFSGKNITPGNAQAFLTSTLADAEQAGRDKALTTGDELLGSGTTVGVLRAARSRVTAALSGRNITKAQREELYRQLAAFDLQILAAEQAAVQDRIARAESLAALQESQLGSDDKVGRSAIELGLLNRKIALEPDVDTRNQLKAQRNDLIQQQAKDVVAGANAGALSGIDPRNTPARTRQEIANAQRTLGTLTPGSAEFGATLDQINQLRASMSQYAFDLAAAVAANVDPRDTVGSARAAVTGAQQALAAARAGGDPLSIAQAQAQVTQANAGAIQAQVELRSSQIALRVAGNDSGLAQSRNALRVARNNLTGQLAGTQGYYDALAQLRTAQRDLANAELDAAALRDQRRGDLSDPLEAARDEVRASRRRLRRDTRSGQGRDVLNQDRIDVTNAELRRDSERFSQRLNDAQIANELGQTSHAQYLHFLDSEHDRLTERIDGMKRTDDGYRQAVEQLQQVDQAIQATKDTLDGMFNLGDIDVPTPFQVRRLVASTTAGLTGSGATPVQNIITVDGTDTGMVLRLFQQLLGAGVVPTVTTAAPKG